MPSLPTRASAVSGEAMRRTIAAIRRLDEGISSSPATRLATLWPMIASAPIARAYSGRVFD